MDNYTSCVVHATILHSKETRHSIS